MGAHMGEVQKLEGGERNLTRGDEVDWVLGGKGEGEKWMKEIEKEREMKEGGRKWGGKRRE